MKDVIKVVIRTIKDAAVAKLVETKAAVVRFIDEHLEASAVYLFQHGHIVLGADAVFSLLLYSLGFGSWALWAHVLLLQNWAFTFVSRARNSGSLTRHLQAGFLSNFVWWLSQVIIFSKLSQYLAGGHGYRTAVLTGFYYTLFTLTGSLMAHAQALRTEKGKSAVGANVKFKQVSVEEWQNVQYVLERFATVELISNQAYACAVDAIPTGVTAKKIDGQVVTTGVALSPII